MMMDSVGMKHREVHKMYEDAEEIEVSTEEFDVVRSKVFNVHSVLSVITAKLKTKPIKQLKYVNIR